MKTTEEVISFAEARFGSVVGQDIADKLAETEEKGRRRAELEQLAAALVEYRHKARQVIRQYRLWKSVYEKQPQGEVRGVYTSFEGVLMRARVKDAFDLYCLVNRDFHELKRNYKRATYKVAA